MFFLESGFAQAIDSLQTAVFASMGIVVVLFSIWKAVGASVYHRIIGWFEKLDKRLDSIDESQLAAIAEREGDRRAAENRSNTLSTKLDLLDAKLDGMSTMLHDHHNILYGTSGSSGLIQDVAYMRGRDDERRHPLK